MNYEIVIKKLTQNPEKNYPDAVEIYTQKVELLDLEAVIRAVNGIE